ncbi:MAG TPA: hypothetical protein VF803_03725 [Candidatus Paceibacterota bacterium]
MTAKDPQWLLTHKANVTSSDGEDGIIAAIFDVIGEQNKWCVELGALNGKHDSNVWNLIRNKKWSGVLIEADKTYFEKLQKEYENDVGAHCVNTFVSFEGEDSLDAIFARTSIPQDFDLFSLDIDGNEYHLWESLTRYKPRVMVVEFNPSIPNDVSFVQPRDMSVYQGSSLRALVELGSRKGYELVAANSVNAFFVLSELFPKFDIADNSIDVIHTDHRFETKLFQLYDGTLKITGNTKLIWHKLPIDENKLQVLSPRKRIYPAMISPNPLVRAFKYTARKLPIYAAVQRFRARFLK